MIRFDPAKGPLDHLLAVSGCVLASYSVAYSINKPALATTMAVVLLIAGAIGYVLSMQVKDKPLERIDGWLFGVLALSAPFLTFGVNRLLPDEGFPFSLIAAVMMWLIMIAGAISAWRDLTLLFLTLPALAIFGLVGTIDSWRGALVCFCVFLVSSAVLYARIHQRAMIARAESLGVDRNLLRRDVWKWMAGPEWAFAAAGVVIVLSFAAAPVVQATLQPVTDLGEQGARRALQRQFGNRNNEMPTDTLVGRGPSELSEQEVLRVKLEQGPSYLGDREVTKTTAQVIAETPRYLRGRIFTEYRRRGWSRSALNNRPDQYEKVGDSYIMPSDARPLEELSLSRTAYIVDLKFRERSGLILFAPGVAREVEDKGLVMTFDSEGSTYSRQRLPREIQFTALLSDGDPATARAYDDIQNRYWAYGGVSDRVIAHAQQLVQGIDTPYERALAIKAEIERVAKYNLDAAAVPREADAVDHFFFESQEGYCDLFASTMVVMARVAGIPARYATGYYINDPTPDTEGYYSVRGTDAHAWAELYFEGVGWVVFDPTEGAETVGDNGVGSTPNQFNMLLANLMIYLPQITLAVGSLIGAALFYWLLRRMPSQPNVPRPVQELTVVHNRFQRTIEQRAKAKRRFSQTLREFVHQHESAIDPLSTDAYTIIDQMESAMFGPQGVDEPAVEHLKQAVGEFSASVKRLPALSKA